MRSRKHWFQRGIHRLFRCNQIASTFIVLLLGAKEGFSCEMAPEVPLDLEPDKVVFTGTVTDVAGLEQGTGDKEPARISVRARELVYASHEAAVKKEYTVRLFGLGPDCSKVPISRKYALSDYPPGTDVWIIGRVDRQGGVDLEVADGEGTYMVRNAGAESVDPSVVYDYCREPTFESSAPRLAFELQKDFVRLRKATSQKAKAAILRRLAFHPDYRSYASPSIFEPLAAHHLEDAALIREVVRFHEQEVKDRIAPQCGRRWRRR